MDKNYQINVVNAEDIQKQSNTDTAQILPENTPNTPCTPTEKPKELRTGLLIGGLITFFISICFLTITFSFIYQTLDVSTEANQAFSFLLFVLTYGWLTYIPGVLFAIIALILNPFVIRSQSKGQKAVGIIFTILSVILVLTYLFIALFMSALV